MSISDISILAIDASAPCSAIAVGRLSGAKHSDKGTTFLAGDERVDGANQASQTLELRIREVLDRAGLEMDQLGYVACGCGPGTFTGTRVALATTQGLAAGLGCPAVSVGTLDALACSYPQLDTLPEGSLLLALLDARRGEVYGRAYRYTDGDLQPEADARCTSLELLLDELPSETIHAIGPGVAPYREQLLSRATLLEPEAELMGPTARGLWRAVCAAYEKRGAHPVSELRPMYLRATYAELGINKPKRPMFKSPFV
jgi:tRNA threonylcarbamoyl adenosine modification protein YeaZ